MPLIVQGSEAVIQALKALGPQAQQALGATMYEAGEEIMAESKARYVPVDTGALRESGFVEPPVTVGTGTSVTLAYGAPYALIVHENPRAGKTSGISPQGKQYKHWARIGEWKFLQTPFQEFSGRLVEFLERGLKARVRALG